MPKLEDQILSLISKPKYQPVKPKSLAKKLGVPEEDYTDFRRTLKKLYKQGRITFGKNHTIRQAEPHGTITGTFRKHASGFGFVRSHGTGSNGFMEVYIPREGCQDASSGDEVLVLIRKKPQKTSSNPTGEIIEILQRATHEFVGTYFERDGKGYVRVDGTVFAHSIYVGDPGAKGAKPDDKVVFEMVRFPEADNRRGEGVITEVLGPSGQPGVDTISIIKEFALPEKFPEEVLEEARKTAELFDEKDFSNREDFTKMLTVTIDPVDARDFDDAVFVDQDPESGHWKLAVHIADVSYFAPLGSALDQEARNRATSVYLPQKVIPMFPEILSNGLASLQEDHVRYVKSVLIEYTPDGQVVDIRFANGAIRVRQRFTYEQVMMFLDWADTESQKRKKTQRKRKNNSPSEKTKKDAEVNSGEKKPVQKTKRKKTILESGPIAIQPNVALMLLKMRDLAMILRQRRIKRGSLELDMPETELEFDDQGRVCGAHFRKNDVSHQIIEEFMLAANEAVATHFNDLGVAFLRRIHPSPIPSKLKAFAEFARILGYKIKSETDRFALQRVLKESSGHTDMYAVHYALLRSLKQAIYSPKEEGHYALAADHYCHFTSPIRRYPDLVIHRLMDQWLKRKKVGSDFTELVAIGDHSSKMERRADLAERELTKVKLLNYMNERLGTTMEVIITAVADYGFYAQAEKIPVEGLVRVATLEDDYYYFDEMSHSLTGKKTGKSYRLGDKVKIEVVRVDLQRRQLDFRVVASKKKRGK